MNTLTLIFFIIIFLPSHLLAEDLRAVDLNAVLECDEYFCADGAVQNPADSRVKLGLTFPGALSVPQTDVPVPRAVVRSFSDIDNGQGGIETVRPQIRPVQDSAPGSLGGGSTEGQALPSSPSSQSQNNQNDDDFSSSAITGLGSGASGGVPMHSGKGHVRGGLLYSDDPAPFQG